MQIQLPQVDMFRLVTLCAGVCENKGAMPVLANLLFSTDGDNRLRVSATDLYLSVGSHVDGVKVIAPGSVAIPARDLLARLKVMDDGPISLVVKDGGQTTLRAVGTALRYTLHGLPGSEFPPIATLPPSAPALELPAADLAAMLASTSFAMSTDSSQPAAHCSLLEVDQEARVVRVVALSTGGMALAQRVVATASACPAVSIPFKAVGELRRYCEDKALKSDPVRISMTNSTAFFEFTGVVFSTKLIGAAFMPYRSVIPLESPTPLRVATHLLITALRRAVVVADDLRTGVQLEVSGGTLRIKTQGPETGEHFDELAVDYAGPDISLYVRGKHVLEILGAVGTEEVSVSITDANMPMAFRPVNEKEGQRYLGLSMPMAMR